MIAPKRLTRTDAVLLVHHSDGQPYGTEGGQIGATARHQPIARFPP